MIQLRRGIVRAVKPTWHNLLAHVAVVWDGLLLIALAIAATSEKTLSEFGSAGSIIRDISRYVFLVFGEGWVENGYPFGTYLALAVMLLHFILAAMPVVTGHMLHWRKASSLTRSSAWIASLQILGQYPLIVVTRNVTTLITCNSGRRLVSNPAV
jgi:hypothetical protein